MATLDDNNLPMPSPIDLRSDTVTRPTPAMRRAMADAPVGDDVFGEDPTVNRLQELGAALLGKEAALFVSSGTQGNLISLLCHCPRGAEILLGDECHIFHYEQGGAAVVGSLVYHTISTNPDGTLPLDLVKSAARDASNPHYAAPGVICLENTHNRCGGTVLPLEYCQSMREVANELKMPLHLDGARLANAAVALGKPLKDLAAPFDSVQFDLSKGLGAPVGGLVAGNKEFIAKARRARKLLGGGMRQAGVIAAAGIVAIESMIERLAEDHGKAKRLANALAELPSVKLDPASVQTNILVVTLRAPWTGPAAVAALKSEGVLVGSPRADRIRLVTHYDVSDEKIDMAIETIARVLAKAR
jgi:threonine aldolase